MPPTDYPAYQELETKLLVMIMRYAADPDYILGDEYSDLLTELTEHDDIAFVGSRTDWKLWMTRVVHALDIMRREGRELPRQGGVDWFRSFSHYVSDRHIPVEELTGSLEGAPSRMGELLQAFYDQYIKLSFR